MTDEFLNTDGTGDTGASPAENQNGPKALREALEKANAEKAAVEKELKTLREAERQRTTAEALKSAGIPVKMAETIPGDKDVSEWIAEFGDVFKATSPAPEANAPAPVEQEAEDDEIALSFQHLADAQQGALPAGQAASAAQVGLLKAAEGGPDAIAAYMRSLGQ